MLQMVKTNNISFPKINIGNDTYTLQTRQDANCSEIQHICKFNYHYSSEYFACRQKTKLGQIENHKNICNVSAQQQNKGFITLKTKSQPQMHENTMFTSCAINLSIILG